jgi:hypothetical protein
MKAQREMSRPQFNRAIRALGFRQVLGLWLDDGKGTSLGMIFHAPGKPAYRASLAKAYKHMQAKEVDAA